MSSIQSPGAAGTPLVEDHIQAEHLHRRGVLLYGPRLTIHYRRHPYQRRDQDPTSVWEDFEIHAAASLRRVSPPKEDAGGGGPQYYWRHY